MTQWFVSVAPRLGIENPYTQIGSLYYIRKGTSQSGLERKHFI